MRAALLATIATGVAPTKAKVDASSSQALPLREMTVAARGKDPIACGSFDGYLWRTSASISNASLFRSSDPGTTWTAYGTNTCPRRPLSVAGRAEAGEDSRRGSTRRISGQRHPLHRLGQRQSDMDAGPQQPDRLVLLPVGF